VFRLSLEAAPVCPPKLRRGRQVVARRLKDDSICRSYQCMMLVAVHERATRKGRLGRAVLVFRRPAASARKGPTNQRDSTIVTLLKPGPERSTGLRREAAGPADDREHLYVQGAE
jgi:hypothetical protein